MHTTTSAPGGSARIVRFPMTAQARDRLRARAQDTLKAPIVPVVEDGGWYHEAAVAEDRARPKPGRSGH